MKPGGWVWLARHELLLAWRDLVALATAGRRGREWVFVTVIVALAIVLHLPAWAFGSTILAALALAPPVVALGAASLVAALVFTIVLSQAIEQVTRAFYTRGDLELILSSPVSGSRVLALRIAASAATSTLLPAVMVAPLADVLAVRDGPGWLGIYVVLVSLGAAATALAVALAAVLFRMIGPRRTRLVAQILAGVIGAGFVLILQIAAISPQGGWSPTAILTGGGFGAGAPGLDSPLWWPARAAMGDPVALLLVAGIAALILGSAIAVFAPRFARLAGAAAAIAAPAAARRASGRSAFRAGTAIQALRRKEWALLRRDPWLISQTFVPLLYLVPPAVMLWRFSQSGSSVPIIVVPFLVMAAGQLSGGLGWVAVSAEDAPDLVASAPVPARSVTRAKAGAVLAAIAAIFAPLLLVLAMAAPILALAAAGGVAAAATSAVAIQLWFRSQMKRGDFRRRYTASRIATFAEAFASLGWAGAAALAALGSWLAVANVALALLVLGGAWLLSPGRRRHRIRPAARATAA